MSVKKRVNRREFMKSIIVSIGAFIGGAMGIPSIAYLVGPALKSEEDQEWIRLGSASKVELGIPTLFKAKIERQTGWIVNETEIAIYVLTENGRDFTAMSNVCTHLGCRVRWIDDQQVFFCPCHNAGFHKDGEVASGPPPKPLDRYEVKVEDDQLFVLGG